MSDINNIQLTTHELWIDGRQLTISVKQLPSNTLRVSWTVPDATVAFDGMLILLSEQRFTSNNFPEDGKRYIPSSNFAAPADVIGNAQVIGAYYNYFGDDISTRFVDVSNVDPNKLYYASIHAASNVLQYYTVGVQSYPLESSRFEKQSDTYAGSIPTHTSPPENPSNGDAYFDPTSNKVLIWNEASSTWLETSSDTVPVGELPPINENQIFFDMTNVKLMFFTSGVWVECLPSNTRVKWGNSFIPLGTVGAGLTNPPTPGDIAFVVPAAPVGTISTPELKVFTLGQWLPFTPNLVQFETSPAVWTTSTSGPSYMGWSLPTIPTIGDFFYRQSGRDLMIWDGVKWAKSDTDSEGTPTSDKVGVGTDGSYDERLRMIKVLKGQLGWPQVCVELSEEQFNIAIDNSLDEFRRRADNAYSHRHIMFTLKQNQNTYYLNDPRVKTDKIVNVLKIHRVSQLGVNALGGSGNLYSQPFVQQFYNGSQIDLVSLHLMAQLSESFEKIFAGNLSFTWDEASRQLTILRSISNKEERVVLEVVMERTEQELLVDRWAKQWLQGWAMAELKSMLGMVRSKYSTVAGPNGGLSLNGDALIADAESDFTDLLRQISDFEVGNGGVNFGNTALFIG